MQARTQNMQVRIASGLNLLAGLWEIAAPFVLGYSATVGTAMTNDVIVGIIVAVLAAIRFFGAYAQAWLSWINALLGVWLIISPFILGYSGTGSATTNDVIVGVVMLILGAWSALATRTTV